MRQMIELNHNSVVTNCVPSPGNSEKIAVLSIFIHAITTQLLNNELSYTNGNCQTRKYSK